MRNSILLYRHNRFCNNLSPIKTSQNIDIMFFCIILYVESYIQKGDLMNKQTIIMQSILPGTPEWESICKQCGLCCLVKYRDKKQAKFF